MIKDSGKREEFSSGAVRDNQEGKGRMDLIPLDCLPKKYANDPALLLIDKFEKTGNYKFIEHAREYFIYHHFPDVETSLLELGVHYEEGAKKYGDNNWQLGLPTSRYISSAIRHYMEFRRGDPDEPHKRSFIWNLTCIIWTCKHKPELNDYAKCGQDKNTLDALRYACCGLVTSKEPIIKGDNCQPGVITNSLLKETRQCGKTLQQVAFEVEKGIFNKIEPTINPNEPTENKYVFVNNPTPSEQGAKFFNQSHREAWLTGGDQNKYQNGKSTNEVFILNIGHSIDSEELVGVNLTEMIARVCGVKTSDLIKEIKGRR